MPGVGRKTANVVLNVAFGHSTIAVDTHVFRLSNRIGIAKGNDVYKVEKKLKKIVSNKLKYQCHNLLVFHGRYTCLSKKPKCKTCSICDLCEYNKKNL